jgi:hypothetical protein
MRLTSPHKVPSGFRHLNFQGNVDKPLRTFAMKISQTLLTGVQIDQH